MSWSVQRKKRKSGWYYEAIHKGATSRQCVSLGYLEGSPAPRAVTTKLREAQERRGNVVLPEDQVRAVADGLGIQFPTSQMPVVLAGGFQEHLPQPSGRPSFVGSPLNLYGAMTLQQFYDEIWWPHRREQVAESTVAREEKFWEVILNDLGEVRMCDLDTVRWSSWMRQRKGAGWGTTMRRLSQNAYRQAVKHCKAIGGIDAVHHFAPIKGAGKRETREPRALKMDEVTALLDATSTAAHRALYATMIGQGLRPGEASGLTWDCWDMKAGVLYPSGTKNRHASKAVPLTPLTREEILPYWQSLGCPTSGPCYLYKGKPIISMYHGFRAAADRADLGHLTPYDCRHTFATMLARNGVNRAAARRLMRHSSVSVILERAYEHMDVADVAKVVEGLPTAAK